MNKDISISESTGGLDGLDKNLIESRQHQFNFSLFTNPKAIKLNSLLLLIIGCFISSLSIAQEAEKPIETTFDYGGYVKFDAINSWYMNGNVGATSPLRDFILPGQIPVGPGDENQSLDFHVKESRFNFDVTTNIAGQKIHGFLELDFLLSSAGDERVSNSFNPRLRHFYFEWKRLLIGQTWSTFMVVVIPDDLDFAGALEGLVFVRQPQIRYKAGNWMFAIENPETTLLPYQQSAQFVGDKDFAPDVVARRNFNGKWGQWSVAGIYRPLGAADSTNTTQTGSGWGVTTGGKIHVGKKGDDFRATATYGDGLGRYLAANLISDGVFDAQNEIQTISSFNGYVAYNHYWIASKLSSSFNVGYFQAFYDEELVGDAVTEQVYTGSANLKYDPVPQMRLGAEFTAAYRSLLDGTDGTMYRLQISAKYRFGYTDKSTIEK